MSLKIECVVDGGMDTEKALRGSGRFESLHLEVAEVYGIPVGEIERILRIAH